jgi:hypothetical protein
LRIGISLSFPRKPVGYWVYLPVVGRLIHTTCWGGDTVSWGVSPSSRKADPLLHAGEILYHGAYLPVVGRLIHTTRGGDTVSWGVSPSSRKADPYYMRGRYCIMGRISQ